MSNLINTNIKKKYFFLITSIYTIFFIFVKKREKEKH